MKKGVGSNKQRHGGDIVSKAKAREGSATCHCAAPRRRRRANGGGPPRPPPGPGHVDEVEQRRPTRGEGPAGRGAGQVPPAAWPGPGLGGGDLRAALAREGVGVDAGERVELVHPLHVRPVIGRAGQWGRVRPWGARETADGGAAWCVTPWQAKTDEDHREELEQRRLAGRG